MIISLNKALDLKIFSPSEPIGILILILGLVFTGMIFYITPTLQFILGYFYYNEDFSLIKLVSFIIIWIAVIIYLKDLYETN